MVDAVHSISTQIHAATAGHKRIELILKRSEFTLHVSLLLDTMILIRGLTDCRNCIFPIYHICCKFSKESSLLFSF